MLLVAQTAWGHLETGSQPYLSQRFFSATLVAIVPRSRAQEKLEPSHQTRKPKALAPGPLLPPRTALAHVHRYCITLWAPQMHFHIHKPEYLPETFIYVFNCTVLGCNLPPLIHVYTVQ